METFEELLAALSQNSVDYILVEGLAVDLCGFSRATMDVDILVDNDKENLKKLLSCLEKFGEGSAKELSLEDFPLEEGCVRIIEDFPVDIFTVMGGHIYKELLPMTEIFLTEEGAKIQFLGVEGLIKLKSSSSRPKDKIDIQELKKLR